MDSTTNGNPTQRRSSRKSKPKVYSDCVMFTSSGIVEDKLNERSPSKQKQDSEHEEQPEPQSKAKREKNESSFAKIPCEPVAIFLLKNPGEGVDVTRNTDLRYTADSFNEEETISMEKPAESGQAQTEPKIDDYKEDDSTETISQLKMAKRRGRRPTKHQSETFSYDSVSKRYVCSSCSKTFRFRQDVQRHSSIHTGSKPYACNLCDKTFSRSDYLNTHLRIHKGIRDVFCDICGQSFYDKSNWRQHVDRCHGNTRPIPCPFENCPMRFRTNSDLKKHIPTHTREKPFQCDVCGRTFSLSSSLQHHLRLHTGEKPYSCDFCDKTFRDVTACRRHKRLHTGEKPYVCQICDKAFIQKGNLTRHFLTHGIKMTCSSVPSEVSTQSQDIYDRVSEEIGHEFSAGKDEKKGTKECDADLPPEVTFEEEDIVSQEEFVSVSFSSVRRSEQQKARWKHTYSCTYCNKVFTAADEANQHIRIEHPEPVNQQRVAKSEIVVVHNSDDPLSEPRLEEIANAEERVFCEVCLKDFRNIMSLKQHMITHTDEKPFICEICGAGFRKNNNLLRHHLVHTGEKPFSCDICQKKFASVGNLKKHKVIHTGEKKYCCKLCGKAFSQSSNLKKHYVTHDSEKKARKGGRNYSAEEEVEECSSERGTLTIIGHEIILTESDDNPEQELEETEDAIGKSNPLGCVLTIEGTDMVVEI